MLIYSTRRKALYKHIFQKVDKDRDNLITFKVCVLYIDMCRCLLGKCVKNQKTLLELAWKLCQDLPDYIDLIKGNGQSIKGNSCGLHINRASQEINRGLL